MTDEPYLTTLRPGTFAIDEDSFARLPTELDALLDLPEVTLRLTAAEDLAKAKYMIDTRLVAPLLPVRASQELFGASRWSFVRDQRDVDLGRNGFDVVGQRFNLGDGLSRGQAVFLLALLNQKRHEPSRIVDPESGRSRSPDPGERHVLTPSEAFLESVLLRHCTREIRDPCADLDVRDESDEFASKGGREFTRKTNLEYARRFAEALKQVSGAEPRFFVTNADKWSMHVDVAAPEGVRSAYLCPATKIIKMRAAAVAELPLAAHHPDKVVGPAIVLDAGIWQRDPGTRGGLWRPPLGRKYDKVLKTHKKHRKLWLPDLDHPDDLRMPTRDGLPEPVPYDSDVLWEAIGEAYEQDRSSGFLGGV